MTADEIPHQIRARRAASHRMPPLPNDQRRDPLDPSPALCRICGRLLNEVLRDNGAAVHPGCLENPPLSPEEHEEAVQAVLDVWPGAEITSDETIAPPKKPRAQRSRKRRGKGGPDLYVQMDQQRGLALLSGPAEREVLDGLAVKATWTPSGRGWVIPLDLVGDVQAYGQARHLLVVTHERKSS